MSGMAEKRRETFLVLLRHGESTFNARGLYQGCSDEPALTDNGRANTRVTGRFLKGLRFDAVYVSPLRRARETAMVLNECLLDLPACELRDELREIDLPAWEGLPFDQVRARFADEYRTWKMHPERFFMARSVTVDGPDSLAAVNEFAPALDIRARAEQFMDHVERRHAGHRLLVVAHGGINRALISAALELPVNHLHGLAQLNSAVSVLKRTSSREWSLDALNLTAIGGLPSMHEDSELLLLLAPPALAGDMVSQFPLDAVVGELPVIRSITERCNGLEAISLENVENAESWWSAAVELGRKSAQRVLLIANQAVLAGLLGRTIGLHPEGARRLVLQPNTFHAIQMPPKPHRAIAMLVNGTLCGGKELRAFQTLSAYEGP